MMLDKTAELAAIGELVRTQNNRITSDPLFVIEKKVVVAGFDSDYADFFQWVNFENDYYEADEEEASNLDELLANEPESIPSGWEKVGCRIHWQFVTCCFTEQGCNDYLEINGHNVGKSRIYVYSGWRNYEWQTVREALQNSELPDVDMGNEADAALAAAAPELHQELSNALALIRLKYGNLDPEVWAWQQKVAELLKAASAVKE